MANIEVDDTLEDTIIQIGKDVKVIASKLGLSGDIKDYIHKMSRRYEGLWHIKKRNQGFDFIFPPTSDKKIVIDILHYDLEDKINIKLNDNVIAKANGADAIKEWLSFTTDKHINATSDNVVRIEHDGNKKGDWGKIYQVVWRRA